jgi:hypothetical protein
MVWRQMNKKPCDDVCHLSRFIAVFIGGILVVAAIAATAASYLS